MAKFADFFIWMFPIRYWYHCRVHKKYGETPLSRLAWEKLMRGCGYTAAVSFLNLFRGLSHG